MLNYKIEFEKWLSSYVLTEEEKQELQHIQNQEDVVKFRFGMEMEFGTAGLRSTMYMGPNCMNRFTVAQTTQAIAELLIQENKCKMGVAIACDSRNNSELFSRTAAEVLAGNQIPVYIFNGIRPTPELSFAIRKLQCAAGINITASHNPKEYNGYKAYWQDGAQISPKQAQIVSEARKTIDVLTGAKKMDFKQGVEKGLIHILDESFDEFYLDAVMKTAICPENVALLKDSLKIVYTPLHGAGYRLVPAIMHRMGLENIYTVPEQMILDGNFPTVVKPNPEYKEVFELGIQIANKVGSDLIIATDPDSDRIGVMTRTADGSFKTITGNQMGALLLDYVITAKREKGLLSSNDYAVKSLVSTDMAYKIAKDNGVLLYDVLTGFKFIGEVIKNYEEGNRPGSFLLGFEESYGYLLGSYARDKDAVGAALMILEMTAYYFKKNMTLSDALEALYLKYGFYQEGMLDIYMEGLDGIEKRVRVMETLRNNPPKAIGGIPVVEFEDLKLGVRKNLETGDESTTTFPKSDVLIFKLQTEDKVIIRPSGTEPKIKIYFLTHGTTKDACLQKIQTLKDDAKHFTEV